MLWEKQPRRTGIGTQFSKTSTPQAKLLFDIACTKNLVIRLESSSGEPTYYSAKFSWNLHENKENLVERRVLESKTFF